MSTALAIAAVTALLKDLLDNAVIDLSQENTPVSVSHISEPAKVTALPPDRIAGSGSSDGEHNQLNLFLYRASSNTGWSNTRLPSHDSRGGRLTNPLLALDLHYLLTAYGKTDLDGEILLGYAMQLFHEVPVLTCEAISKMLATWEANSSVNPLPRTYEVLKNSELSSQIESIRITPQYLNTEELSKLWTAMQARYRPSMAYMVTVVLIEAKRTTRSPLPVLTRGRLNTMTGRDEGVIVQPHLLPPYPTLQEASPPKRQLAIRMGETLTLRGHHLNGDEVAARFTHVPSKRNLELKATSGGTPTEFQVKVPSDPAIEPVDADSPLNPDNWQAGVYSVAAIIRPSGQPERISNELPIALAPSITIQSVEKKGDEVTITVNSSPKVWKEQRLSLIVGDREIAAESIPKEVDKTDTLTFKALKLPTGPQWLRLRVDGIDSILIDKSGPVPVFDSTQQVEIPL